MGTSSNVTIETGRWYDIKIEIRGERIRCYLDGKLIQEAIDASTYDALYAVSGVDANGDIVLKVVNVSDRAQNIKVSLNGAGNIGSEGLATVLTAESPMHENSYKQPKKVAPVKKKVSGLGKAFIYSFDKNSVTILRIKTEK